MVLGRDDFMLATEQTILDITLFKPPFSTKTFDAASLSNAFWKSKNNTSTSSLSLPALFILQKNSNKVVKHALLFTKPNKNFLNHLEFFVNALIIASNTLIMTDIKLAVL